MVMATSAILTHHEETINFDQKVNFIDNHHGDHESDATGLASKSLVQKVLKEHIARIDVDNCEPGEEDAFYVADLGEVYRQHLRWKFNLGRVKPFYGMFCLFPYRDIC
jgi:ornithine decarboxylase